jgi:pimeloyl-ACP methyl ester carboxylesterase
MTTHKPDPAKKYRFELLDRPEVSQVLFHIRHDVPGRTLRLGVFVVRVEVDEGIEVGGRLYRARPDAPAILYFHGNGETASDYDMIAPLYTQIGVNLLVMDYRGYGISDGQPTASCLLADAVVVYEKTPALLAEHALSSERLFVMGRSLGSAAAIEIAERAGKKIAGLIIESGFAYTLPLLETLGLRLRDADEARDGFGHLDKIAQVHAPTLIIHGEADWLIPIKNGHALYEHSGAADKRLVTIPNAGHNDLLFAGKTAYFEAIQAFIDQR